MEVMSVYLNKIILIFFFLLFCFDQNSVNCYFLKYSSKKFSYEYYNSGIYDIITNDPTFV